MSGERQDEWILVLAFDELFVGCCIRFLCGWCGGLHVGMVLGYPERCTDPVCGCSPEAVVETSVLCKAARRRASPETKPHLFVSEVSVADGEVERLRPDGTTEASAASRPARAPAESLR